MTDLFSHCAVAEGRTDTSREAAKSIGQKAQTIRSKVAERLRFGAMTTADEMAAFLELPVLTVRPRFSELRNLGLIVDSGRRRKNRGGRSQIVWRWKPEAPSCEC